MKNLYLNILFPTIFIVLYFILIFVAITGGKVFGDIIGKGYGCIMISIISGIILLVAMLYFKGLI